MSLLLLVEARCTLLSLMLLSLRGKVQLVHMWCYPVLQETAVA